MSQPLDTLNQHAKTLFAKTLGLRFIEATPERVVAELDVREELCTTPGIMHGGAIMAFADTLGGAATSLNLPPGAGTTTIESKTNFFAPGRTGETVRGECIALHRGKRTMVWQTRVTSLPLSAKSERGPGGEAGRLLALVTQTQIVLEARRTEQDTVASLAELFEGKPLDEQKKLLAQLERSGAALYRGFAAAEHNPAAKEALLAAARREEENAEVLEKG